MESILFKYSLGISKELLNTLKPGSDSLSPEKRTIMCVGGGGGLKTGY